MGVVERFKRTLSQMEAAINPTIQETINKNKPLLIDEQTNEQMFKGEDSQGQQFVPSYALSTTIIKKKKGQPTNRVTLKDTGDLYSSIDIQANTTNMIISANIEYFKYLVVHYDQNIILGLQRPFLDEFTNRVIAPAIGKKWTQIIRQS